MEENNYLLTMIIAKRAKQLLAGAKPLIKTKHKNPVAIALEEVKEGNGFKRREKTEIRQKKGAAKIIKKEVKKTMKKFERIFIYLVLTILVFCIFSIDKNVESQVSIQEEIRARNIIIVDDQGKEILKISANENGGIISIYNKAGKNPVEVAIDDDGFGYIIIYDSKGPRVY